MKFLVINGPNINMLGIREQSIYGNKTYSDLEKMIISKCNDKNIQVEIYQSNYEGDLITKIQEAYNKFSAIIINAGAYTHTSIAILDALKSVGILTVEVHITDIYAREEFRHKSFISYYAEKSIIGEGIEGYIKAIEYCYDRLII